jgi:hypothetical protein
MTGSQTRPGQQDRQAIRQHRVSCVSTGVRTDLRRRLQGGDRVSEPSLPSREDPEHQAGAGGVGGIAHVGGNVVNGLQVTGHHAGEERVQPPLLPQARLRGERARPPLVLRGKAVRTLDVKALGVIQHLFGERVVVLLSRGHPMLESACRGRSAVGSPAVQGTPLGQRDLLVDAGPDQSVHRPQRERPVRDAGLDETRLEQHLNRLGRIVHPGDRGDVRKREPPRSQHRGRPKQRRSRPRQPGYPNPEKLGEFGWRGKHPHSGQLLAVVFLQQRRQVERIARRVLPEPVCSLSAHPGPALRDQARGLRLRETGQRQMQAVIAAGDPPLPTGMLLGPKRTRGRSDEHLVARCPPHQPRQSLDRLRVGPVQILRHEQHRRICTQCVKMLTQRLCCHEWRRLRPNPRRKIHAPLRQQAEGKPLILQPLGGQRLEVGCQLGELAEQGRLAGACVTLDHEQGGNAGPGPFKRRSQDLELIVAPQRQGHRSSAH